MKHARTRVTAPKGRYPTAARRRSPVPGRGAPPDPHRLSDAPAVVRRGVLVRRLAPRAPASGEIARAELDPPGPAPVDPHEVEPPGRKHALRSLWLEIPLLHEPGCERGAGE